MAGGFSRWKDNGHPWKQPRTLTREQSERYSRHTLIPEVGEEGQLRLLDSKVLLIGAGGLGSPAALYLAAAGVGTLGIIDADVVDRSNLQRQILHTEDRIGITKVDSAEVALKALNPEVTIVKYTERLDSTNVMDVITGYDVIVDGTDNFPTRYLLNDASLVAGIPVVHGSIYQFEGSVTVYKPYEGPCYRCQYPEPPPPELAPSCAEGGVLGVLPGVVGTLQATEAVKLLLGIGDPLIGRQLRYDALAMEFVELKMHRDPALPRVQQGSQRDRVHRLRAVLRHPGQGRADRMRRTIRLSTVRMPPILRQAVGGAREVEANGSTVRELLDDLTGRYPAIKGHLLDDGGELNRFVNVYVNNEDVRLGEGLDTSVGGRLDGDRAAGHGRGRALAMPCLEATRVAALSAVGNTPLVELPRMSAQGGRPHLRQAGGPEPDRVGQGPRRAVDDRGGRGIGRAGAGAADPRADQRQHRHRAGDDRQGQGLPGVRRDAGVGNAGARRAAAHVRRRHRLLAGQPRLERRGRAGTRRWQSATRRSTCRSSTPTRRTRPPTTAARRSRSSTRCRAARSTPSSPVWARAGR